MYGSQTIALMETIQTYTVSEETYFALLEKLEAAGLGADLEYLDGLLIPKHASNPLGEAVIAALLETLDEHSLYELLPMATPQHTDIVGNIFFCLKSKIVQSELPYKAYTDGLHIFVRSDNYKRPDVTLTVKEGQQFNAKNQLLNPVALFEVLSPSTQEKDHNEKLQAYTQIESLQTYVLVAQDRPYVAQYTRLEATERWLFEQCSALQQTVSLGTTGLSFSLAELYEGLFPQPAQGQEEAPEPPSNEKE